MKDTLILFLIEHTYDCNDRTDEAVDLTCTECYPQGEKGHYNCSCWANPPRELEGPVYRTCQDALRRGENKSGVYTLKPNHLDPFQVCCLTHSIINERLQTVSLAVHVENNSLSRTIFNIECNQ